MESLTSKALVFEAFGNDRYKDAVPALSALADLDDVDALLALAWLHETGTAGEQNLEVAKTLYQRAGEAGSSDAWYRLGRIFKKSNDLHAALVAFKRGANQNYLPCISALGLLMIRTAQDQDQMSEGMRWLTEAADQGHFFARKKILDLKLENESSLFGLLKIVAEAMPLGIRARSETKLSGISGLA